MVHLKITKRSFEQHLLRQKKDANLYLSVLSPSAKVFSPSRLILKK